MKLATKLADKITNMITGYEDCPEANAREILPLIEGALKQARNASLEEAAVLIENHSEAFISLNSVHSLQPRLNGSLTGLTYANRIRALKGAE